MITVGPTSEGVQRRKKEGVYLLPDHLLYLRVRHMRAADWSVQNLSLMPNSKLIRMLGGEGHTKESELVAWCGIINELLHFTKL